MAEDRIQRRLVAILAADVVGYTRLMERDEAGTLSLLKARRKEILDPLVARHQGRIFKIAGDGAMVQFGSAVNAVQCAIDLQQAMAAASGDLPEDRRIILRIGINLGDVMVEGSDFYGGGVNIAARLEAAADPGGILVSGTAYDHARNKVAAGFEDLGTQALKNIGEPMRVYRVTGMPRVTAVQGAAASDSPSIAVLPFTNMSGDAEQQYFGDGITEDIITELSRFRQLHVVARNSSFRYRGPDVDVARIGRELGVQYLVEGSVRRLGERMRITAQLIDTASGHHVWADRFDRNQEELFAVQDQVVRTIVGTLMGRLRAAGVDRVKRKPPASLAAYECVLRGDALPFHTVDGRAEARRLFEKAIELDPGYARAYSFLANIVLYDWFLDMSESDAALNQALDLANKAVALDANDDTSRLTLGRIHAARRSFELAEHHCLKALEMNRNSPSLLASLGDLYVSLGQRAKALACFREARELDPFYDPTWYWASVGLAYFYDRRYEEAIAALSRSPDLSFWSQAYLAATYALSGRPDQARHHAAEVLRQVPDFSIVRYAAKEPLKHADDLEHLVDGMRKAGLPE
jgi:adenylate cyclase